MGLIGKKDTWSSNFWVNKGTILFGKGEVDIGVVGAQHKTLRGVLSPHPINLFHKVRVVTSLTVVL
jgi:hypothetical protein